MRLICRPSRLRGEVRIPGSKSHTIRAVAIAGLAVGDSAIRTPLDSNDTLAAVDAYRALGAGIEVKRDLWMVRGTGGEVRAPDGVIDVRNSGVTLHTAMAACCLLREGMAVLTGDEQIRRRPAGRLAASLNDLGGRVRSTRETGTAPFVVEGRLRGGETTVEGVTSQHPSALLIATPLADGDSVIRVTKLNEAPYLEMTLDWLRRQGIALENDGLREFRVRGGQSYRPVDRAIPADWSSATFFLGAGAMAGNEVVLRGLDMSDTQGDKMVIEYVRKMGAEVTVGEDAIRVKGGELVGCELDLNATPDALPMMAVLGCSARGSTRLVNVPQARIKESDRITAMATELGKLGGRVEELPDGLVVHESELRGAEVESYGDHRIVMALAVAGCGISRTTVVHGAEAAAVTFPEFVDCMKMVNANLDVQE